MGADHFVIEPDLTIQRKNIVLNPGTAFFKKTLKPYYVVTQDNQYLFGSRQVGRNPDSVFYMVPEHYRLGKRQRSFDRNTGKKLFLVLFDYLKTIPLMVQDGIQGEIGYKVGLRVTIRMKNPHSGYIGWMGKMMIFPPKRDMNIHCWNYIIPEPLPLPVVRQVLDFWPDFDPTQPLTLFDLTGMHHDVRRVLNIGIDYFGGAYKKPNLTMVWNKAESDGLISYHAGCTEDRILKGLSGTGKTTLTVGPKLEQDDAVLGLPLYDRDGKVGAIEIIGLEAASFAKSEGLTETSPEWEGLMISRQLADQGEHHIVLGMNIDCERVSYCLREIEGYTVKVPVVVKAKKNEEEKMEEGRNEEEKVEERRNEEGKVEEGRNEEGKNDGEKVEERRNDKEKVEGRKNEEGVGRVLCTEYHRSGTTNGRFIFPFITLNPKWGHNRLKILRTEALSFKRFDVVEPIIRVVDPAMAVALDSSCESIITSAIAGKKPGTRIRSYSATDFMAREQSEQALLKLKVYTDLGLGVDGKLVFFINNCGYVGEHDFLGNPIVPGNDSETDDAENGEESCGSTFFPGRSIHRGEKITVSDSYKLVELIEERKIKNWMINPIFGYFVPDPKELEEKHGMKDFRKRFNPLRFYSPEQILAFAERDIHERTAFLNELFRNQRNADELREVMDVWSVLRIPDVEDIQRYYESLYGVPDPRS